MQWEGICTYRAELLVSHYMWGKFYFKSNGEDKTVSNVEIPIENAHMKLEGNI